MGCTRLGHTSSLIDNLSCNSTAQGSAAAAVAELARGPPNRPVIEAVSCNHLSRSVSRPMLSSEM